MPDRLKAIEVLATLAHRNQVDKQGRPYIDHVRAVADMVSPEAKPVALCHDLLEDTELGAHDLLCYLTASELDAVLLLTRVWGDTYDEYIHTIVTAEGRAGKLAREVKIADLTHHLDTMPEDGWDWTSLRKRYEPALAQLREPHND